METTIYAFLLISWVYGGKTWEERETSAAGTRQGSPTSSQVSRELLGCSVPAMGDIILSQFVQQNTTELRQRAFRSINDQVRARDPVPADPAPAPIHANRKITLHDNYFVIIFPYMPYYIYLHFIKAMFCSNEYGCMPHTVAYAHRAAGDSSC